MKKYSIGQVVYSNLSEDVSVAAIAPNSSMKILWKKPAVRSKNLEFINEKDSISSMFVI